MDLHSRSVQEQVLGTPFNLYKLTCTSQVYFLTSDKKTNTKALTPVAFKLQGRELVLAVPPCLAPKGPLRYVYSELPHPQLSFGFHPPELAKERICRLLSHHRKRYLYIVIICGGRRCVKQIRKHQLLHQ